MNSRNFRRTRIQTENLMQYIDQTQVNPIYKEIVKDYMSGMSYPALAKKYDKNPHRIPQIIYNVMRALLKVKQQSETE